MRFLKSFFLSLLFFGISTTFAQTYLVTSNADAGPGTLRQGLINASLPGRTTQFVINFQLPGSGADNANRTIRLRTALPNVASKVTIDGSSQASWTPLGVSGAKIIIEPEFPNSTFNGLNIGQFSVLDLTIDVEIYGLYLRNFATINNLQNVNLNQGSGIVINDRVNNITIGAKDKGNVIGGSIYGIWIRNTNYVNIVNPLKTKIQSNIIGLVYDGITPNTNVIGVSAELYSCPLDLGGDNNGEGNVIAANRINVDISRTSNTSPRFDINVVNNKIGVDYSGQRDYHDLPLYLSSSSIEISGLKVNAVNSALHVRNNVIGGNRNFGLYIANADFIVTGNAIGSNSAGNTAMGNGHGIKLEGSAIGTIGGTTVAESNIVANNVYGIETTANRVVKITRNSMYCNQVFGIGKTLVTFQPFVQILKKRANYVAGRATANSEIELFYTENCAGICEGKTYITTVQAGSDGRWEYNGVLTGKVTATASLLNATTSPFATAELILNEALVEPVTCNGNGSITIPEPREGFSFSWVKIESNGTRTPKGFTQSIDNLDVGSYEVTVDDGCKPFATVFEVKDQILTKPTIAPVTPFCGQMSFTLTASVFRGKGTISYEWYDTADLNTIISRNNPATLPQGNYLVKAIDEAGCSMSSDAISIVRKPQPRIKVAARPNPATCGLDNGSITQIELDDVTGTAIYAWYKHDPITNLMGSVPVGTDLELIDVGPGNYTLLVTDGGTCPISFGAYNVGILNSVAIGNVNPNPARCGDNNGSIPNVTIANGNYYEWRSPNNTVIQSGVYTLGMDISLNNLAPGTYTLIARNTANTTCSATRGIVVNAIPPKVFSYSTLLLRASCGVPNSGSVALTFTSIDKPSRYEWRDDQGTLLISTNAIIAGTTALKNIVAGNYYLTVWDINNCQIPTYGPFTVGTIDKLAIVANSGTVVDDGCGLIRGSISGIQVVGGLPPYIFTWKDAAGNTVGYSQDLLDAPASTYTLTVKDQTACGLEISQPYTINDVPFIILPPNVADIRVCYVSDITIPIIGVEEGTYQIFAENSAIPFLESKTGVFNFKVSKTADYYVRRKLGTCVSVLTKMHVEVTHDNLEIGNVITPNGDGKNDTWMLEGLPDFKGNNIKIYTRSGQLVYEAIGNYVKPFDGLFRGKELPAGVYFYTIDLRAECKPIGGSITLLR